MRLYRMELYKLCHRKIFIIWSAVALCLIVLYFWTAKVGWGISTVDGTRLSGYDAIKREREITEEYRGELTDEKVRAIVAKYGLPSKVVYDYGGWYDANYLNRFVADFLTDGYLRDWNNYRVPTKVYPIADTELGSVQEILGKPVTLAYTEGWDAFFDTCEIGMTFAVILIIFGVSVLFAEESQTKMLPLLCTTKEGKEKDIRAKIGAAFTLTIIVYTVTALLSLALCACVFGLDGADCPLGIVIRIIGVNLSVRSSYMPVSSFAVIVLGFDLLAMLLVCAMTLCVSAHCKSSFGAVTMAACFWGLPLLISILFGGFGYFISSCMPLFLVMTNWVYESVAWGRSRIMPAVIVPLLVFCVWEGYGIYKRRGE